MVCRWVRRQRSVAPRPRISALRRHYLADHLRRRVDPQHRWRPGGSPVAPCARGVLRRRHCLGVVMRSSQRRTVDPSGMRDRNATLILKMIWDANEISRADLARNTGMSPSTVSAIVAELQEAGLVRFVRAGASTGGRRPQLVAFCDDAYVLIGIEVGAKHVTIVAMDMRPRARRRDRAVLHPRHADRDARDDARHRRGARAPEHPHADARRRRRGHPSPVLPGGASA